MDEESRRRLIHSGLATEKELDLAAERDTLRAENSELHCLIASSDAVRENACQSIEGLQAEAAAMRDALTAYRDALSITTFKPMMITRAKIMVEEALSTTAGAAMLRVIEAAKEWKETGDGNPLEDALAEMERDRHA